MSRIAKQPVILPSTVEHQLSETEFSVKGPKGQLRMDLHPGVKIDVNDNVMTFSSKSNDKLSRAMSGTTRALVFNLVHGVSEGFVRQLDLVGVGYRAQLNGQVLELTLGFSHPIRYTLPKGVACEVEKQTKVILTSIDKRLLGQVAAEIRAFRPPEPYKGKGVRYSDEVIKRKEAKKK